MPEQLITFDPPEGWRRARTRGKEGAAMAKYVELPDVDRLARLAADPKVRELVVKMVAEGLAEKRRARPGEVKGHAQRLATEGNDLTPPPPTGIQG